MESLIADAGIAAVSEQTAGQILLPRGTTLWQRLRQALDEMALVAGYEGFVFPQAQGEEEPRLAPFSLDSLNTVVRILKGAPVRASLWRSGTPPTEHHIYTVRKSAGETEEDAYTLLDLQRRYFEEILAIPALAGAIPAGQKGDRSTAYALDQITGAGVVLRLAESSVLAAGATEGQEAIHHGAITSDLIPALLLAHLREGLPVFPPRVAPEQVVIIPVLPSKRRLEITKLAHQIRSSLRREVRLALDESTISTTEEKQLLWAKRGAPVQILIGEEDLDHRQVALLRRDTGAREVISVNFLADRIKLMLTEIQDSLLDGAFKQREEMLLEPETLEELTRSLGNAPGYALAAWDGTDESAAMIREKTGLGVRLLPFGAEAEAIGRNCIASGKEARFAAILAGV